jgi:hypothetical protein
MTHELERIWKDSVLDMTAVISWNLPGGAEDNYEKHSRFGVRANTFELSNSKNYV